ncbi:cupredoxin domain-containing protein [Pinibacter aurantiacus]|uniref:Cupredoxin family copper-binding protein n=1 Tax=Pinibacter aurantiacus TaxID=2851599 RepID=A0A9E2S8X7_9BACT|nr:cupredoxin family copper-binding protein [Pinibacter aurantiacus]MBV4356864.1 cupredoxin family copper-binding protein [Pinibacter aurantiacus]
MKTKLISAGFLIVLWSTLIVISCSKDSGYGSSSNSGNNQGNNTVSMQYTQYDPSTITVKAGTTITWINNDNMDHTVTANDGSFDSGTIKQGGKYTHTFSTAGTFSYHCTFHANMKGSVVVQ